VVLIIADVRAESSGVLKVVDEDWKYVIQVPFPISQQHDLTLTLPQES
jgi:hypothetical protein